MCWSTASIGDTLFNDSITRLIRTYVPILVGMLITQFPFLDGVFNETVLVALVIAAYYSLASLLEKVHPFFGYLLGVPKTTATTDAEGFEV